MPARDRQPDSALDRPWLPECLTGGQRQDRAAHRDS
jgi:hypothetical protein